MGKLNYSSTTHLAKMIKLHTEKLEELLENVEIYRKYIYKLADELEGLLKEAQK